MRGFSISDDGGVIAFSTRLSLLPEATNRCPDGDGFYDPCQNVYVYDRSTGHLTIVNVSSSGALANHDSGGATLSSDGRYVFFESRASNLAPGDHNGRWDVFRHDRVTGQTIRVSLDSQGGEGRRDAYGGQPTADGQKLVFVADGRTFETNAEGEYNRERAFVRDLTTGITRRLEPSPVWDGLDPAAESPTISADGRTVALKLSFTARSDEVWEIHDLANGTVIPSSAFFSFDGSRPGLREIALSADGQVLASRHTLAR